MTLTRRQHEVLRYRATGLPLKDVAARLGVSENTIKRLSHDAYEKLEAACLVDAMIALGWVRVDGRTDASETAPAEAAHP